MVQRVPERQFNLSSMMGGMTLVAAVARKAASAQKFSVQPRAGAEPDTAVLRMSNQEQTMAVLHKAFGGDVNGANTQNAARALGVGPELGGTDMLAVNMKMNVQFMALQNTIQQDGRKGASISNASKARHDSAMSAIRNLK